MCDQTPPKSTGETQSNWYHTYLGLRTQLHTSCHSPRRALFGHADGSPNVVTYVNSGEIGLEEMVKDIDDTQYMYGLGMCAHYYRIL